MQSRATSAVHIAVAVLLVTALMGFLPASVRAAEPLPPLVHMHKGATGVEWAPASASDGFLLTVSGPDGFYLRQEVAKGETATFEVFDEKGAVRPDGSYVYEVRHHARLDDETRREMEPLRKTGRVRKLLRGAGLVPERTVESGSFAIVGGTLVGAGAAEEPGPAAPNRLREKATILTISDGTINNSLCVGFDCSSSPPFGDSTILLQEVNTRIKFDDTSSSSYPDRDWELTANDSVSGGIERFSITDCGTGSGSGCPDNEVFSVEAGVRENALYIEQDGEIGLGTANPDADIHVVTGDTPTLRLEQDGSQSFTPQTWNVFGNEAGFIVQDVTAGSFVYPFRIEPGAPTHSLVIEADGDVGLGTLNPTERFHLLESANENTLLVVQNGSGGSAAAGVLRAQSNGATVNFQAHGSGRTLVRFGETIANWSELLQVTGDGLILGTLGADPLILGTNSNNVLEITAAGDVLYQGSAVHSDYVFEPGYELPSIEEQEAYMWSRKHLPAIGPARYGEDGREIMALGSDRQAIVEELEKAHIYIAQLNRQLDRKDREIAGMEERNRSRLDDKQRQIDELATRLAEVETLLTKRSAIRSTLRGEESGTAVGPSDRILEKP